MNNASWLRRGLLALFLLITIGTESSFAAGNSKTYYLEGVADGDTIYVRQMDNRVSYRVRFAMVDAPEKTQSFGQEAKSALIQMLQGQKTVTVTEFGHDRYGRIIGIVSDSNGRNLNLEMVRGGYAWVYSRYAAKPAFASYLNAFENAQNTAQLNRAGLWRDSNPLEPWKFRRG